MNGDKNKMGMGIRIKIRINPEMIFNESIRYLEKLKRLRPDLKEEILILVEKIKKSDKVYKINF